MVDILERQIELVFAVFRVAAIFRAAIGQHATEPHFARIIERHDAIVEEISGGDRRLAVIEFGEGDLGIGVDEGLLIDAADPIERILTAQTMPQASGSIRFPAHHLMVTLDSCAALALWSASAANPAGAPYAGISR
jgi:hypothetical protein